MRNHGTPGLAVAATTFGLLLAVGNAHAQAPGVTQQDMEDAAGSYIFVFKDDVRPEQVRGLAEGLVRQHGGALRHSFDRALRGFSVTVSAQAAERMARNPHIKYYERNAVAWAQGAPVTAEGKPVTVQAEPAQVVPYGIIRVGGGLDGSGRHAWVIDTGIDLKHPDLHVGSGANFVTSGTNSPQDGNGHGTHVAGTIGAINNGIDVVGVAANATVHPVRVLNNNGSGTIDWIIAGVNYVATHAAPGDVANMSLGASGHIQSLHDAIVNTANLGIRFTVAAGNSSADSNFYEPAHIEHANVYTESAVGSNDVFASFSNYANPPVDFAAPGVNVLSTRLGGGVVTYSGTSMAAPHVAGLLLLGIPVANGYAVNDPDGTPDPIAHY